MTQCSSCGGDCQGKHCERKSIHEVDFNNRQRIGRLVGSGEYPKGCAVVFKGDGTWAPIYWGLLIRIEIVGLLTALIHDILAVNESLPDREEK
jgi:hypothetical protein